MKMMVVLVLTALAACADPCPDAEPAPAIDSYDLGCDVDEDCAVVSIPSCGCSCPETPLRAADVDRFVDEQTICCAGEAVAVCDQCIVGIAVCVDNACAFGNCSDAAFVDDVRCQQP